MTRHSHSGALHADQRGHTWKHLPTLAAATVLLIAGSAQRASADTVHVPFQADVTATETLPAGPCSNGAYICGTATLAGYGAASWDLYPTAYTPSVTPCGSSYAATTYFTLANDPGSTLVVDEAGSFCGLGHDGAAYRGYFNEGSKAYGHPFAIVGGWTVDPASTGQFSGLAGSGTDRVNIAGAHVGGSYSGTLG